MTVKTTATTVTREQIARCSRVIDCETMLPFYLALSETDNLTEYAVKTIRRHGKWHVTCTCPAGLRGIPCKHRRWAAAAAAEYKELIKAEAQAQARIESEATRQALYNELNISYASANVDNKTLARIAERNKKPAPTHYPCIQARPFSILK